MNPPSKGLKVTVLILRTLMGLLLVAGAVAYFLALCLPHSKLAAAMAPPLTGDMKTFNDGLMASHYLMPVVKAFELLGGLAFLTGRFVPLAAVLLAPIIVNILAIALVLNHDTIVIALFVTVVNALVAYTHRDRYAPLFRAK